MLFYFLYVPYVHIHESIDIQDNNDYTSKYVCTKFTYFVPLDAIEFIWVEVVAAGQVGRLAALHEGRDPHGYLRQALQL